MKNFTLLFLLSFALHSSYAQLTVGASPASATICAGNPVSLSASATPVTYTVSAVSNNSYDPTLYSSTILVDQLNAIIEPVSFGTLDDGRWDNITLPFTFRFYGNTFNAVNISTNGWIGLGSSNSTATGYGVSLPNAAAPNNVIHAISADLTFAGASNAAILQYFEVGVSPNRKFVIDYSNIKFFTGSATADVQVILYETTNVVEIHTTSCTNTTEPKAQGIENSTGTVANIATGRNNTASWTGLPNAYRFTPDNINFTWSPATGLNTTTGATVIASPSSTTTYTVSAVNPSNGFTGNTTVTVTVDPASHTLAGVAGGPAICQNISVSPTGTTYRGGNCNIIAKIVPAGASPVSNSINTCMQLASGSTRRGTSTLYAARKYEIEPLLDPATSTADITLYYLQSDFNEFNTKAADSGHRLLPTGPSDLDGINNLVLRQFHGTGTNPGDYSGSIEEFSTLMIGVSLNWNGSRNRWEMTIPVNGFSGFFLTTLPNSVLPIKLEYFKGTQQNDKHVLNWKVNCSSAKAIFEIERSTDGQHFFTIGKIAADQLRCAEPFEFTDASPASGMNYYRIQVTDPDDRSYFSNTISFKVRSAGFEIISLGPNPVTDDNAVLKINAAKSENAIIRITDVTGRTISTHQAALTAGINQVTLNTSGLVKGTYQLIVYSGLEKASIKFVRR